MQAFRGLVRKLLTESSADVADWSRRIRFAVGENGQEIVGVIPELELIIGRQAPLLPLVGAEAQARFNHVFRNFVRALTGPNRPLVLFADDLHWADLASLKLLRVLLTDPDLGHLLVVGPYRDNEVGGTHPLATMVEALEVEGVAVTRLALTPLGPAEISRLVADSLHATAAEVAPLAALLVDRTQGNPYAANEYLSALHRRELIRFQPRSGRWAWDIQAITLVGMQGDIDNLVRERVARLSPASAELVSLAAAIGAEFDLATLARVCGRPVDEVASDMSPVLHADLVVPLSEDYKYTAMIDAKDPGAGVAIRYRFRHDRVQESAYDTIPASERPSVHARIGRALLVAMDRASAAGDHADDALFEVVGHLNIALPVIAEGTELWRIVQLNLRAAQRAKASNAYAPALAWLTVAMGLIREEHWTSEYETAFHVHLLATEVAYLATDFDAMSACADKTLANARTRLDKASVYEIRIQSLQHRKEHTAAVGVAKEALKLLGQPLPERPGQVRVLMELMKTRWQISRAGDLANLPEMKDPTLLAVMRILVSATSSAFFVDHGVFPLIVLRLVALTAKHGVSGWSAYGYVTYGLVLMGAVHDIGGPEVVCVRVGERAGVGLGRPGCTATTASVHARLRALLPHRQETSGLTEIVETGIVRAAGWHEVRVTASYVSSTTIDWSVDVDGSNATATTEGFAVSQLKFVTDDVAVAFDDLWLCQP